MRVIEGTLNNTGLSMVGMSHSTIGVGCLNKEVCMDMLWLWSLM